MNQCCIKGCDNFLYDDLEIKGIGNVCISHFKCWYLWTKARMGDYDEMFLELLIRQEEQKHGIQRTDGKGEEGR